MKTFQSVRFLIPLAMIALFVGCSDKGNPSMGKMPPPEVNVMTLKSATVDLTEVLPGRLEASRTAEVRARVSGIVEQRLFVEGSDVKAGDVLYLIDDAPYKAKYAQALADQAKAKAALAEAKYQAERYEKLVKEKAISEFELIRANAQYEQAKAQLASADAQVISNKIDLDYTRVTAPIDGRIGRGFVTEGALVSQAQATLLAQIQQVDTMYVNVQESSRKLLQRYRANEEGKLTLPENVAITLILPDGSEYTEKGQLLFNDINVEQGTGQVMLRALIENAQKVLMPGLFVQVRLTQARLLNAFSVPQRAVSRNDKGDIVMIVDEQNILTMRPVTIAGSVAGQWVITDGVKEGEKIMLDGFQKARPGAAVTPKAIDVNKEQ